MYADHAATSHPVLFIPAAAAWANPSASHRLGLEARRALEAAQGRILQALGLSAEDGAVVITSGGTESNNLVLQQPRWRFIITMATEHHAIHLAAQFLAERRGVTVVLLPPDGVGRIARLDDLRECLHHRFANQPGLVSLAYVNNEIGTIQDLAAVGALIRAANASRSDETRVCFHTDAVQAPGHVPLDFGNPNGPLHAVDFLTLSAHKFHGPYGVGALVCRRAAVTHHLTQGLCFGGGQQGGLRPGTEPVALAVAMADALRDATDPAKFGPRVARLAAMAGRIWACLRPYVVTGLVLPTGGSPPDLRAPHHVSFCVRGAQRRYLIAALERDAGVLASGGSACSSQLPLPSHVLVALGVPPAYIHGSIRLTLGHTNTDAEVDGVLIPALRRLLDPLLSAGVR